MTTAIENAIKSNLVSAIDVTDPNYNLTDWINFNGSDWTASKVDCHGFGELTVITNNDKPTLKLFIAKEVSELLEYNSRDGLSHHVNVHDSKPLDFSTLNKINDLAKCYGRDLPSRGTTILNYAGFNTAIMKSNKPNAKVIQQWIYGSVMPSIAETGKFDSTENNSNDNNDSNDVTTDNTNVIDFEKHSGTTRTVIRSIIGEEITKFLVVVKDYFIGIKNDIINAITTENKQNIVLFQDDIKQNIILSQDDIKQNIVMSQNNIKQDLINFKDSIKQELLDFQTKLVDEITTDIKANVNRLLVAKTLGNRLYSAKEVVDLLNTNYAPPDTTVTLVTLYEYMVSINMILQNGRVLKESINNKLLISVKDPFRSSPDKILFTKRGIEHIIQTLIDQGFIRL